MCSAFKVSVHRLGFPLRPAALLLLSSPLPHLSMSPSPLCFPLFLSSSDYSLSTAYLRLHPLIPPPFHRHFILFVIAFPSSLPPLPHLPLMVSFVLISLDHLSPCSSYEQGISELLCWVRNMHPNLGFIAFLNPLLLLFDNISSSFLNNHGVGSAMVIILAFRLLFCLCLVFMCFVLVFSCRIVASAIKFSDFVRWSFDLIATLCSWHLASSTCLLALPMGSFEPLCFTWVAHNL